jgi:phosphoglycolate phosphatase-like HAD superfamily hydrolase
MKYIFDFDDVLFDNTSRFKPHMFRILREAGIPEAEARAYYQEKRGDRFSLRTFIKELLIKHNVEKNVEEIDEIYQTILKRSNECLNFGFKRRIQKTGSDELFIVTNGDEEFQMDKIKASGILAYIPEDHIHIVPGSKKEKIEDICRAYPTETILVIDNRNEFFKDLDIEKFPRLVPIHHENSETGQSEATLTRIDRAIGKYKQERDTALRDSIKRK